MTREQIIIQELVANICEDISREQWTKHMLSAVEEAERYLEEQASGIEYSSIKTVPLSRLLEQACLAGKQVVEELVIDALAERIEWVEDITYILLDVFALRQIVANIICNQDYLSEEEVADIQKLISVLDRYDAIPEMFIDISA